MRLLALVGLAVLSLAGCGSGDQAGRLKNPLLYVANNEPMTGYIIELDAESEGATVDITDWTYRGRANAWQDRPDAAQQYELAITPQTRIVTESGAFRTIEALRIGEKIRLEPPENEDTSTIAKVTILEMELPEKYRRYLSPSKDLLRTIVYYEPGEQPRYSDLEFQSKAPRAFNGGISWVRNDPGGINDFARDFDLRPGESILVFNADQLVYKTDDIEAYAQWLNDQ